MEHISLDDVEQSATDTDSDYRRLSDSLKTTDVAINYYRLAPGDRLPGGLHAHVDQEEIFVVVDGKAVFETMDGEVTVSADEAIRFAPGEFQSGANGSDVDLVILAIGAPRDSEDVRIPQACPECGHDDMRLDTGEGGLTFVCPDCAGERRPGACPVCDSTDLRFALGNETQVAVVCSDCGAEFETPPPQELW